MPIIVNEPKLEKRLSEHAAKLAVPSSKSELIRGIAAVVLDAADRAGVDVGQVLVDLRRAAPARTPNKAA
jgi:hypothetical protein